MESFVSILNQYARNELMVLVPVLYILSKILLERGLAPQRCTVVLLLCSIVLSGLYTFASVPLTSWKTGLLAVFTSVTQGVLYAGAGTLGGMIRSPYCLVKSCCPDPKTPPCDCADE